MGIDFEPGNAHWSYSGFHHFRNKLAASAGINLDEMEGFNFPSKVPGKSWNDLKDPIVPLLNHSDCDGELNPAECGMVSKRLRDIVSTWEDDYDKEQAILLSDAMNECARTNKPLEFR